MERPKIKVTVVKPMNQAQWFDFFADDWYIGCMWGTATVEYSDTSRVISGRYGFRLNDNHGVWWVDEIKRRAEKAFVPA